MLTKYPKTVKLKDGAQVQIRPLARDDFDQLLAFFESLPDEDRLFLRHDVRDPELIRKWTEELDLDHVIPLGAFDGDTLVGDGAGALALLGVHVADDGVVLSHGVPSGFGAGIRWSWSRWGSAPSR